MGCRLWGRTESDMTEGFSSSSLQGASQVALVVKTPPSMQETKRENSARTRACGLQNLKYLLSDPLPAFTYSCPVAAALFEGLVKTQCWLLHPEFGAQGPENWRF